MGNRGDRDQEGVLGPRRLGLEEGKPQALPQAPAGDFEALALSPGFCVGDFLGQELPGWW